MKHEFKPFDKVLVRDCDTETWIPAHYSRNACDRHIVIGGASWRQCIPYESNEHRCGTKDSPEEPFKKGDAVVVWSEHDSDKRFRIYSHYDSDFHKHVVFDVKFSDGSTRSHMWDHAERFVPAPVEDASAT